VTYKSLMVDGTPFECYEVYDGDTVWPVYVKRDDLACEPPGPQYSKMRGLEAFLHKQEKGTPIGVQDAGNHSRSGWGTAYLCSKLGFPCYAFYAVRVAEGTVDNHVVRPYQQNAKDLGAVLMPLKAGRASMLWYQARKILAGIDESGIMLPAGLKLKESAEGTARETVNHTPEELRSGTWILSISSGTTGAGCIMGLVDNQEDIDFIAYMGSSKNESKTRQYMIDIAGYEPDSLTFVDDGWKYSDADNDPVPFPASPYYEAKAWHWMIDNIHELTQPIVFWNIGN
jgi:1-aminocyclopropane-1-carboxylate deaminase/D-cysteine desulfhydrase-like pyridoxal-dependent ACC family enzyme